ncbi:MAG: hypothetical protein V1725_04445 [archaeon]
MSNHDKKDEPHYKMYLDDLRKSKTERELKDETEEKVQKAIHATLVELLRDTELLDAIREYGHPIQFAEGGSGCGYSHLEINPKRGLLIVIRDLDYMADSSSENHLDTYAPYIRDGRVFFKEEKGREVDAAKAVRHRGVSCINVDYSKVQTADSIKATLEKAIEKIITINKKEQ